MSFPKAIAIFLISGFAGQIVYYYPNLPEKVASHFNAGGAADGWLSKDSYLIFQLVLLAFAAFFAFIFPILLGRTPAHLINIPHKDYWLAPERRRETLSILRGRSEWFAIALCALLIGINQLVIQANLANRDLSPASWLLIGAFLLFVIIWSIRLCRNFNKILK